MEDNQIIIDVGLEGLIDSLRQLKAEYDANAEAIKALDKESDTYEQDVVKLQQQQKVLKKEMSGVEGQIQNVIKAERAQENSLVQLRAKLANLNKQYDSMSGMQRMGADGQALQKRIKALSDEIMGLEGSTGRWQRNVGNYQSALQGLSGSFRSAGIATGGLDKALKLLNANPIILIITAIVAVAKALADAFKRNEEATMGLREAFSALNPIIDLFRKGLDKLVEYIVGVVTTAIDGLVKGLGLLLDTMQAVGNFFGADWHMGDNFREGAIAARELQKAEDDYIKAKRRWLVESAEIDREVADLREKATDKEKYNAQQRLEYLDQAIALETKKAAREKELAEENLRMLQQEAARSANDAEMNDKLAEAERAVIEADTRLSDTKRNLSRQRNAALQETKSLTNATSEYIEKLKKLREEYGKLIKVLDLSQIHEGYEKELKKREEATRRHFDELAEIFRSGTGEMAGAQQELMTSMQQVPESFGEMVEDAPTAMDRFAAAYQRNADVIEQTSSAMASAFGSVSQIYQQLADDETKTEEERAEAARKARRWSALQIAANSGTAMAKGIAGAMDVPFPANLGALATVVGALLTAIAQAKALASDGGFATGGVVGGFVGATMGPDNTMTSVRRGEMVLNAEQQRRLFAIANTRSVQPNMAAQLAAAIKAMPAPVLTYREFKQFEQSVIDYNDAQILK